MTMKRSWSIEVDVVGLAFRWKKEFREHMAHWDNFSVMLEREPDNKHDENAIKVCIAGRGKLSGNHLGYLRKETAAVIAPRLDAGTLKLKSASVNPVDAPTGTVQVVLRFEDVKVKVLS